MELQLSIYLKNVKICQILNLKQFRVTAIKCDNLKGVKVIKLSHKFSIAVRLILDKFY